MLPRIKSTNIETGKRGSEKQKFLHEEMHLQLEACESCHKIMVRSQSCGSLTCCSECSSSSTVPFYDSDGSHRSQRSAVASAMSPLGNRIPKLRRAGQLLLGISGIYASYLSYGLVQEELYRYRDVHDDSAFTYVWFLQVMESTASVWLGVVGRFVCGGRQDLPIRPFVMSGISQVFAKVFCSLSLAAGTSFPIATLAKSAKIVPVMLGQLILGGSTYNVRDYLFAGLLVTGTLMLSLGTSNRKQSDSSDSTMGIVFMLLSLLMDGCTGGLQKRLKRDTASTPPSTYDFLLYTHISMLSTALLVALATSDLWNGILYLQQHPDVGVLVAKLCGLSVIGQSFIFYVIAVFDPMVCATVTTTRKMWSVLLSIISFHHQLSFMGYSGLALALAGLAVELQSKVFCSQGFPKPSRIRKTSSVDDEELAIDLVDPGRGI